MGVGQSDTTNNTLCRYCFQVHPFLAKKVPEAPVFGHCAHLLSTALAAQKGVKTIFTKADSMVDLGLFSIQLMRSDNLDHLDLAISRESKRTAGTFNMPTSYQ